ncbi:MAG: thioesterase family protein [Pseudomonadales bacterium]
MPDSTRLDLIMPTESCFRFENGRYLPLPACRGPWDPSSLSGSVIVSLLAFAIEQEVDDSEYLPARLTIDLYRLPDFSPVEITTTRVRDGYRIKVIDAEFIANGISMARASCQMLRKTENSPIKAWSPANWDVPMPEDLPATEEGGLKWRRRISGDMNQFGPKRMWVNEQRELVQSTPLSAWLRAAMVADLTNPWANSGQGGLGYINSDVTLYLHRLPTDDWIGMDVVNHQATDGVAIGECWLYDRQGLIGTSTVTGLAQKKRPNGG